LSRKVEGEGEGRGNARLGVVVGYGACTQAREARGALSWQCSISRNREVCSQAQEECWSVVANADGPRCPCGAVRRAQCDYRAAGEFRAQAPAVTTRATRFRASTVPARACDTFFLEPWNPNQSSSTIEAPPLADIGTKVMLATSLRVAQTTLGTSFFPSHASW
jgi:hypothetical protein